MDKLFRVNVAASNLFRVSLVVFFAASIGRAGSNLIVFSADGNQFLSAIDTIDRAVTLWETNAGKLLRKFEADASVGYANLSADGKIVFFADGAGKMIWADAATGKHLKTLTTDNQKGFYALSPDRNLLVSVFNRRNSIGANTDLKTRVEFYESDSGKLKKVSICRFFSFRARRFFRTAKTF